MQFRKVNDQFALAGQLSKNDILNFTQQGYKAFMCNRPDGEGGDSQPAHAALAEVAKSQGAKFYYLPMNPWDEPDDALCQAFAAIFNEAPKPLLVFCRTGNRSGILYEASKSLIRD